MTSKTLLIILFPFYLISQEYTSFQDKRDERFYKTLLVDNKIWMAENLNTSKFQNGDEIPHMKTYKSWITACNNHQPAFCYFNNKKKNGRTFGKLYNWYAITDPRGIAPEGMSIPTESELATMVNYYCSNYVLKENPDWNLTDSCISNSLITMANQLNFKNSGARINGSFLNANGFFIWTRSECNKFDGTSLWLSPNYNRFELNKSSKQDGYSIRCFFNVL